MIYKDKSNQKKRTVITTEKRNMRERHSQTISSLGTYSPGPTQVGGLISTCASCIEGGRPSERLFFFNKKKKVTSIMGAQSRPSDGHTYHTTIHVKQFPKYRPSLLMFLWDTFHSRSISVYLRESIVGFFNFSKGTTTYAIRAR